MLNLVAAALFFVALHRVISGSPVRHRVVNLIGETMFQRLFAFASIACLAWLWFGFQSARTSPLNALLFTPSAFLRLAQIPLQLVAFVFIVAGLTTRNPTTVGMAAAVDDSDIVQGALRITRHPFLWGVALFAGGHMLVRPSIAAWVFFGTMLVVALTGTVSIDAKRQRSLGDRWQAFAAATSNVPFMAILSGRQHLQFAEIGWWRPLIGVALYAALAYGHPRLFGVSALP